MQNAIRLLNEALFIPRHHYADRLDQVRARITMFLCVFVIITTTLLTLGLIVSQRDNLPLDFLTLNLVALLVGFLTYFLVSSGRLRIAGLIIFGGLLVSAVPTSSLNFSILTLALPLLYGILMYRWSGLAFTLVIEVAAILINLNQQILNGNPYPQLATSALTTIAILVVLAAFAQTIILEFQNSIKLINRLLTQLRATSEIAQSATTTSQQDELLKRIASYIRDRFGFYQVQLFLIDRDHQFASLVATTSEGGQVLQERGYRVAIGSPSIIGQVTLLGEALSANLTDAAQDSSTEPDRPGREIQSQVGLPLIVGDQILGVLDIQSTVPNAFTREDIESLRIIAIQVSITIRNAQQSEEQKIALNENRRLFLEAELNLREMQRLNQRLTGEAWDEYLKARVVGIVGYTVTNNQLRTDSAWTPALMQAASKRRPVLTTEGDKHIVAVPVELRGKAIGAIEVETDGSMRQTETLEMLQSVAQRLALSIDNARLFEQAQELAQQELQVNTISAKLQGITGMDEIVKVAVDELSRALGAEQASIRLTVGGNPYNAGTGKNGSVTA